MSASIDSPPGQSEQVDRSALLLMLSYVEAECRRLGATAAAEHAAKAAALVPEPEAGPIRSGARPEAAPRRPRSARLH